MAYNAVELGALVALGTAQVVLGLARAELAEVLSCPRYCVFEELKCDPAKRFTWSW